jgi:hypothetical protein
MANKPQTSHFVSTDSSDSTPNAGNAPDRSHLSRLYPEPKTYEQKKQDVALLQQSYRLHWPKYPFLNIAAYGSIVLGVIIWFVQSLNTWWFGSGDWGLTMSTVFFSFAIWIMLVFLLIAWVNYVNKLFSYFGSMIRVFWLVYTILIVVLLVLWLSGWLWEYTNILWPPILTVIHFIVVFFIAKRIVRQTL